MQNDASITVVFNIFWPKDHSKRHPLDHFAVLKPHEYLVNTFQERFAKV